MEMPRLSLKRIEKSNGMCFGCGQLNTDGLKLKFVQDGKSARADFIPDDCCQGWPDYVHGGLLVAAMDEAIGWITVFQQIYTVTAKMDIRFKSMARIGEPLIVSATIAKQTKRLVEVEAQIKRQDGSIVAESNSLQYIAQAE
jgi:acyl-coenzyme A thioesterase PaaI-like protein